MASPEKLQTPWIDITELPPPIEEFSLISLWLIITAVISLLIVARYIWRRPRITALRHLSRLQKQSLEPRQQLFMVHQTLQQGLKLSHLHLAKYDATLIDDWLTYCNELMHYRYSAKLPSRDDVLRLTQQAMIWIKRF